MFGIVVSRLKHMLKGEHVLILIAIEPGDRRVFAIEELYWIFEFIQRHVQGPEFSKVRTWMNDFSQITAEQHVY